MRPDRGLTLISLLVYISLLALLAALLTRVATGVIRTNTQSQLSGEVIDNAQRALAVMTQAIQQASAAYTPTSRLGSHPGQLSVVTTQDLPADENVTYADFYVDDEHLYLKRENNDAQLLTSQRVRVENFVVTLVDGGSGTGASPSVSPTPSPTPAPSSSDPSAVRISLTLTADVPGSDLRTQTSLTLTSTVSFRAY